MKNFSTNRVSEFSLHDRHDTGFTMLEFLIAMAMFLVVGGMVLAMFASNAPYFNRQQNLVGLNIAMQNAVSQLQLDLANAGTGYYPGTVIPSWPIGVTIANQPSGSPACNNSTNFTYSAACFDQLNILTINPSTLPANPTDSTGGTSGGTCSPMIGAPNVFYVQPSSGLTAAQTAAQFSVGDQLLLVSNGGGGGGTKGPNGTTTSGTNGAKINTFVITAAPVVGANYVALTFAGWNPDGTANDPLGISTSSNFALNLATSFCAGDWVMKLEPTTYYVDVSVPTDPKLMRRFGSNPADVLADQLIGFKVGAATYNINQSSDVPTYSFYAANDTAATPPGYLDDFPLIRSVRVTLIGRTTPNPDPTYTFRNTFDGGPYQVQGSTVVINPRNMTMNNN